MRPGQPAHTGRLEPAVLAQVDRHPVGAEELDDPVERGLERMRQRELRLRLGHEREQLARSLELERGRLAVLRRLERMCRASREGVEAASRRLGRRSGEAELQCCGGRLTERERESRPAAPTALTGERMRRLALGVVRLRVIGSERRRGLDRVAAAVPQDRAQRPGGLDREPDDLSLRTLVVASRGERLALLRPRRLGHRSQHRHS